ncbi:SGNH/GDSL hydrolase family protein [Nocardia yamanashiensis]|uniref:SGNH/GDSL hydrolase family protein n=1 Tax=Nocardia yamanashiensis TaxID=209247 RepID=UPI001E3A90D7|nr:SGNH/GDSL hydrolase family protein [Nocardia yamanashiensis]UGT38709.1 SGNH/GDSL hydrolase family protein [Nocardia yamanashiensis]
MRVVTAVAAILVAFLGFAAPAQAAPNALPGWEAVWATAMHTPNVSFAPNWSQAGFADQSVRQVIRVSDGGSALRVRLSNAYGTQPLEVSGATIARTAAGAGVVPDSVRPLTSGLSGSFRIAPGAELATDPVLLPVSPLESLTITLYFAAPTGPATYHAQALGSSYLAAGDHRADIAGDAFGETSTSFYYLSAVETADLVPHRAGVALFGDSITDGYGATNDGRNTYPDEVAERLAAQGQSRAVLNLGIGGNRVTVDSAWMGESALHRFQRDVVGQPGIGTVVVLEGINDIGLSGGGIPLGAPFPVVSAQQLIDGHRALIAQAHAAGLRVIGATLLPFGGSDYYTADREAVRAQVNAWIRTSGEYDAVVDLDTTLADPADRARLLPGYDVGDHLHPSDAGYAALADAVVAAL